MAEVLQTDSTYWQSPPLFYLRLQVNYDLMTFGDRLQDGSSLGKLTSLMEHLSLKCPYDQIFYIHFFYIFVHNRSSLDILPNFNLFIFLTKYRTHVFYTFISLSLQLSLIFLVPILG